MSKMTVGDLVYLPWPETAFAPAKIVGADRSGTEVEVELETTGETQVLPMSQLRQRYVRPDGATSSDNTSLDHMNDATILENIRIRHSRDEIYTYTASVLLAVNPYKDIQGLYGDDVCGKYRGKHIGALPPHPYAIADTAYRALVREHKNQGMLISGESGAGKTETAKIVMNFLAYTSGAQSSHADNIQSRLLRSQPILESFGNAVTMRNSNSSRFGKYNRVFFDTSGTLVDAGITTYLLESSRVVVHGERERTYHCFYEMLRGLEDSRLQAFGLERSKKYRLLTNAAGEPLAGFESRDAANFERLVEALGTMGMDEAGIDEMLKILAGLIHLGDLEKDLPKDEVEKSDEEGEPVQVNEKALEWAAKMLGMDSDELASGLTKKKVAVRGRTSYHEVARTATNFRHALQSFIKAIYKRLFDRTVERINGCFRDLRPKNLAEGTEDLWSHIGILDIYGFENLQKNSFEQLCINLANERLQQYFVENVLRAEQELYKREGLPWTGLPLPDAEPVFSAIGQVFKTLDEYSQNLMKNVGNPTDKSFCQKVVDESSKDQTRKEILRPLKMGGGNRRSVAGLAMNDGFTIKHYAGQVQYNTTGWLDKNNDRLLPECESLICESSNALVKSLGDEDSLAARAPTFKSISKKYTKDLQALLDTLSTCNLHYIRCFKPNGEQKANKFSGELVLDQIVQCGTIELVKIMHDGYPNRCPFEEITNRFRDLLPERFQRYGMRTFIEALMLAYEVPSDQWALGMSRLFLKAGQLRALEGMRSEGATPPAEKLSEIVRGIVRKRWVRSAHAVMLVNFLPKFAAKIYAERAAKSLAKVTVLSTRIAGPLQAAKQRLQARKLAARRRLVKAIATVRLTQALWKSAREQRAARLAASFRLAALLHKRTRPWVALARERAAEEAVRKEAERKREEERRRIEEEKRLQEEERQREERERLEAEKKRLEEEQRKAEEEARLRAEADRIKEEEQKRLEEERQQWEKQQKEREEELQAELERERAKLREKDEEERKKIEDERKKFEEERKAWEEEKKNAEQERQQRAAIMEAASPSKGRTFKPAEVGSGSKRLSGAGDSTTHATGSDLDDFNLGDSVSVLGGLSAAVFTNQHQQQEMQEQVKRLEREMAQKHDEIKAQMALLQERNASLERQLIEERTDKIPDTASEASGAQLASAPSPPQRKGRPSLIPMDDERHLQSTPGGGGRKSISRSGQRYSIVSVEGSASRSTKAKRQSIAHEALLGQQDNEKGLGDAVSSQELGSQRKWWAEQRQFLLDDLYGGAGGAATAGRSASRMSTRPKEGRVSVVAEEGEVRSLAGTFDSEGNSTTGQRKGRASGASETGLRQPTKFEWNKRQSNSGVA